MGNLEKDVQALLGDAGYQHYVKFSRAQSSLEVVTALAGNLYRTDAPFSGRQGEQLMEAVIANTRPVPVSPGSKVVRYDTDWAATAAQAQSMLAPSQRAVFDALLVAKKLQQQMSLVSAATRAAANPKPGGG